jgi:hypothetical protein
MAIGRKTGGRKKGTPNKTTSSAKEALTLAFGGLGGVPALEAWAKNNLTEFYKLWGRLVPTEISGRGKIEHTGTVHNTSDDLQIIRRYMGDPVFQQWLAKKN